MLSIFVLIAELGQMEIFTSALFNERIPLILPPYGKTEVRFVLNISVIYWVLFSQSEHGERSRWINENHTAVRWVCFGRQNPTDVKLTEAGKQLQNLQTEENRAYI